MADHPIARAAAVGAGLVMCAALSTAGGSGLVEPPRPADLLCKVRESKEGPRLEVCAQAHDRRADLERWDALRRIVFSGAIVDPPPVRVYVWRWRVWAIRARLIGESPSGIHAFTYLRDGIAVVETNYALADTEWAHEMCHQVLFATIPALAVDEGITRACAFRVTQSKEWRAWQEVHR